MESEKQQGVSRRGFLRGSALGAISIASIGVLGACSPQAAGSGSSGETRSASEPVETLSLEDARYDVDVVVVGSGAAGMSAALEAKAQGGNVLMIESNSAVGGTTSFAEGILGVNSRIQQNLGIKNSISGLVQGEMEFSNYAADARLIRDFLEGADENITWLEDMGVEFYTDVIGGTTQHLYVGQGKEMIKKLEEKAAELGIETLLSTRGKRLFMEDGAVAGIVAEDGAGEFPIRTKSVILACGGFVQNDEMIQEMLKFNANRIRVTASPFHDGEGVTMAYQAGGDQSGIALPHFIWCSLESFDLHSELSTAACNEPFLFVDEKGRRFTDESLTLQPSVICNAVLNQKRAISILPQAEVSRLMSDGCTVGWGSYIFAGAQLTDLQNQLDEAVSARPSGFFFGETLKDLATALEMDAAVLTETVQDYNAMCNAGEDTEFFKPAPFLRPVAEEGPFYAFELLCNIFCTMGGVRINQQNEVIDENFDGIPGLYCAGVDCSGLQGTTYCIKLGGGAQGYAVYSGRNSARNAVAYAGA